MKKERKRVRLKGEICGSTLGCWRAKFLVYPYNFAHDCCRAFALSMLKSQSRISRKPLRSYDRDRSALRIAFSIVRSSFSLFFAQHIDMPAKILLRRTRLSSRFKSRY